MVGVRFALFPVLAGLVLFYAGPARACPGLEKALPRVGSTVGVDAAPSITLWFSGEIEAKGSEITVTDSSGRNHVLDKPVGSGRPVRELTAKLNRLAPGLYKVRWHIPCHCDGKGAVMPGGFSFIVKN